MCIDKSLVSTNRKLDVDIVFKVLGKIRIFLQLGKYLPSLYTRRKCETLETLSARFGPNFQSCKLENFALVPIIRSDLRTTNSASRSKDSVKWRGEIYKIQMANTQRVERKTYVKIFHQFCVGRIGEI